MTEWFVIAGGVALLMAYAAGQVRRMPLSTAVVYLAIGYLIGPNVLGLVDIDARVHSEAIRGIAEIVIVVSIFSSALKLRVPALDRRWLDPLRLALVSLVIGAAGAAVAAHYVLGFAWGAAALLGAILAPTDPVLASDVQVERPYEFNRLRFALTGEAGMNDGAAFPLVLLGLALTGVESPHSVWVWILVNVLWGFAGAVAIGALLGYCGGRFMLHLRLRHGQKLGTDSFLALGIMGLSYGLAEAAHALGFVAVFAAGVAVRRIEGQMTEEPPEVIEVRITDPAEDQEVATDPEKAPSFMLLRVLSFTESLERIGEAVVVILVGALLRNSMFTDGALLFAPVLFFLVRPLSVFAGLLGTDTNRMERGMAAWFGIRGMASVYYIAYIHERGAPPALVHQLAGVVIGVIAYSILAHGISVTPLMNRFERAHAAQARGTPNRIQ